MKFIKKIGGLFLLALIIGLILFIVKNLVEKTKESILIETKTEITPTPTMVIKKELAESVRVIDGDTVRVKINGEEKSVRLIGIDTPEKNECFEKEATKRAKELMENKKIKLESDNTQDDKDKYDRLLRYVYLEDGTLVNKKLIEEGFGTEYTYKIPYKFQTEFKESEKMAKGEKMGIWADDVCVNF